MVTEFFLIKSKNVGKHKSAKNLSRRDFISNKIVYRRNQIYTC